MRIGIIQSCYIPWRGYFDFIDDVDRFIVFDDVQYPVGRSFRNRNKVKTRNGTSWLTVPVQDRSSRLDIDQVRITEVGESWRTTHRNLLAGSLAKAPYYREAMALWEPCVAEPVTLLSELNLRLMRAVCEYLQIGTPLINARELAASGSKSERLLDLIGKVGGTVYLSGPSAEGYLDLELFRRRGVGVEYKSYDYAEYPQMWGEFAGAVSILDLIANCGPASRTFLKSRTPNLRVA